MYIRSADGDRYESASEGHESEIEVRKPYVAQKYFSLNIVLDLNKLRSLKWMLHWSRYLAKQINPMDYDSLQ